MIKELLYKWFGVETPPCASCDTLREQLAIANIEKKQMLESILSFTRPAESQPSPVVDYEQLKPKMVTWNVRRQMLEAEDRRQAQILAEQRKAAAEAAKTKEKITQEQSIEQLEKELGISEEVKSDA